MATPKQEAEGLMNELLPLAKRMLAEHGEFFPYGGFIQQDGSITHLGAELKGNEQPDSKSLINLLAARFRAGAAEGIYRATAIVFNVRITPPGESGKTDAIQVNLDQESGYSAQVLFPYTIASDGRLQLGRVFAQRGDNQIFPSFPS